MLRVWNKILGKGAVMTDPRWEALNGTSQPCPCCGQTFSGVFDISFDHPDMWPHGSLADNGGAPVIVGKDILDADMCWLDEDRFVKGLIELPILGTDQRFAFGVWCSLKPENFDAYTEVYGTDAEADFSGCFGWVCNALPFYDTTEPMAADVRFRDKKTWPFILLHNEEQGVGRDQVDGLTLDRLLDIYAASGTDLRPHLDQIIAST